MLGTDTSHRRYIINSLIRKKIHIKNVIFEKKKIKPIFEIKPKWYNLENKFNNQNFFKDLNYDLKNINSFYVDNLNSIKTYNILKKINPDYVIVSGARKINDKVLRIIKKKSFNIHLGNALKYRGLDSNLWALYHRDFKNIGVTIHRLNSKLDTGNILAYEKILIRKDFKPYKLRFYESKLAVKLLAKVISKLSKKKIKEKKQDIVGQYYSFMPKVLKDIL